jgi:hypothetical protein
VRAGEVEFYVEVAESGEGGDGGDTARGMQTIGDRDRQEPMLFDGVRDTVRAIAGQLVEVWDAVAPDEARVEFSLAVSAKSGKLTGLLVDAGGDAALKVALVWRRGTPRS